MRGNDVNHNDSQAISGTEQTMEPKYCIIHDVYKDNARMLLSNKIVSRILQDEEDAPLGEMKTKMGELQVEACRRPATTDLKGQRDLEDEKPL
jgi:hypothetical protein